MRTSLSVDQLGLAIQPSNPISPTSRSYRPPSWPPPKDWICVEDKKGNPISKWGDPIWDISAWIGSRGTLNFCDGPRIKSNSIQLDEQNANLFRIAMTWRIWGHRGAKAATSILVIYGTLKPVFSVCSRNGILASELSRYPKVIEELAGELKVSTFKKLISELNTLLNGKEFLGFVILDSAGISQLKVSDPGHKYNQTVYIPPRIWQYQVLRLKEFLDDYLVHQNRIEKCYEFCIDAYSKSYLSTRLAEKNKGVMDRSSNFLYTPQYSPFLKTADQFGIKDVIEKWVGTNSKVGVKLLSKYLNMASFVGLAYTLNFTLARISEGMNLRFNCLVWHDDDVYGRTPLIKGETSKTMKNEAALWVASPSVEIAIAVMQSVTKIRNGQNASENQLNDYFLINYSQDPWQNKSKRLTHRPKTMDLSTCISQYPLLFEGNQLSITEEDFRIAFRATPTLDKTIFQVGKPWHLSWHQLRRTGAVNMFSSGDISDTSIQLQLKHLNPVMTQYYGRGHTTLNLSEDIKNLVVNAQYEVMGKMLADAHSESFISPFGLEHKERLFSALGHLEPVNLIAIDKVIKYEKAARSQKINFRVTAIGACMKNGRCDGDGFSALGDCAGGGGKTPCANALFDRNRAEANKNRLAMVIQQIESAKPDTPRYRHLEQERRGLENYFAYIR